MNLDSDSAAVTSEFPWTIKFDLISVSEFVQVVWIVQLKRDILGSGINYHIYNNLFLYKHVSFCYRQLEKTHIDH